MKKKDVIAMTLCCLFFAAHLVFADASLFSRANAKYQAGDFKAAADLYQEIIRSGKPSASVYYNLANASFRLGQKGKALIFYERALRANPRDPDIRWNMDILKMVLSDRMGSPEDNSVVIWIRTLEDKWTMDEIGFIFSGGLAFFTLLLFLNVLFPSAKAATAFLRFLVLLFLFLAGGLSLFKWQDLRIPRVVVMEKEVYARYGPSPGETQAFLLHEGAEGAVLDETQGWFYVKLPDQSLGWIPREACEII